MTTPPLSDAHREYLNRHAVTDVVIEAQGIWSDGDMIVFPWRHGDQLTLQRRLWPEPEGGLPVDTDGKPVKYKWEPGKGLHFNIARDPGTAAPILLCEGTKQHLAVASWAPPEYAVYGMAGCWAWKHCDLSRFDGRDVIIILDADAAEKSHVYDAGEKLRQMLELQGARPVFASYPGIDNESTGIDDFLAGEDKEARRTTLLKRIIDGAQKKPAPRRPPAKQQSDPLPLIGPTGLPIVIVNQSRQQVVHEIINHMQQKWNGRELFCYGGVLARLRGAVTEPLDKDSFVRWMIEAVDPHRFRPGTQLSPPSLEAALPEGPIIGALLASGDEFAELAGVSRMPFIRPDGTVCSKNGYDYDSQAATGTRVLLAAGNSGMDRLDIPDAPSRDEAQRAAAWLLDTWLSNMPWKDTASRANALALILTPFIRGSVPRVPLAVISGLQPSVGKNLLADCLSLMTIGEDAAPLSWTPDDDDEIRKALLSVFRSGATMAVFDEAHVIGGAALTKALTAATYTDRILGVSKMASYPNRMTWIALGNQVQVLADMARRAYFIELYPTEPHPENRPESAFDIPQLREWTLENRPELVTAALTVIRSWYAAGQPAASRGESMGSFETWDRLMSGILAWAGVDGFLSGLTERRAERDASGGEWEAHLGWLREQFGPSTTFTTAEVRVHALADQGAWESPPNLDDPGRTDFTKRLGMAYVGVADRWMGVADDERGGCRLVRRGKAHRKVSKWCVEDMPPELGGRDLGEPENPTEDGGLQTKRGVAGGTEGPEGPPTPDTRAHAHDARAHDARVHTRENGGRGSLQVPPSLPDDVRPLFAGFDLETLAADELFTSDRGSFVRLAGVTSPGNGTKILGVAELIDWLAMFPVTYGHNILGFDGLALAYHHDADWIQFAAKARDTELIARQADPPRSRESGSSADRYGLDQVAERLGLPGKTDDLGRLKRKYGGYGLIPPDDPEYRAYLEGDLRATSAVADKLLGYYDMPGPQYGRYLQREHRLAGIAGQMTLNGFLVDQPLLEQRIDEVNDQKRQDLALLHDGWGMPLVKIVMKGRGKDRQEEEQELAAPLAADVGRAWLEQMYKRFEWPNPPRTAKAGKLALGAEDLRPVLQNPKCHPQLRAILVLVTRVTGSRTVYQTARDCLAADGRVHPVVSMRQASGRWSVTNPGLTVFGKRGGRHVERDIFLPDPGHVLLSFDLSQVDMRAIAGLSQDRAYMELFAPGKDAHAEIGAQVGLDRQSAKAIGHGWNYGLGAGRMIRNGLDPDKVNAFIKGMEERFGTLIAWREQIRAQGRNPAQVLDNGFGRRMRCDPDRAYTVAPALMGQGGARDIMCESLLKLPEELWPLLRVMVHDEIVMSVPKEDAEEVARTVLAAMNWSWQPPGARYSVPILADMSGGANWGLASAK